MKKGLDALTDLAKSKVCPSCGSNPCMFHQIDGKPKPYTPPSFQQGGYKQGGYQENRRSYKQEGFKQGGWRNTKRKNNASKGLSGLTDLAKGRVS